MATTTQNKPLFARLWQCINGIIDTAVRGTRSLATNVKVRLGFGGSSSTGRKNEDIERQNHARAKTQQAQTYVRMKVSNPARIPPLDTMPDKIRNKQQVPSSRKYTAPANEEKTATRSAAASTGKPSRAVSDIESQSSQPRRKCHKTRRRSASEAAREEEEEAEERKECTSGNLDAVEEVEGQGVRVRDFATGYDSIENDEGRREGQGRVNGRIKVKRGWEAYHS